MEQDNKKVLIYTLGGQHFQEACQLDVAAELLTKGYNIYYITCDSCVGGCMDNRFFNRGFCKFCSYYTKKRAKKILGSNINISSIDDYYDDAVKAVVENKSFNYNNAQDIKNINYKGVEIGYGAMSSYISLTRNLHPIITPYLRRYLDLLLQEQVIITEIIEKFIIKNKIELIVFHNGRFAHYKPLYGLSVKHKIDFICTESVYTQGGKTAYRNIFYNGIPHDPQVHAARVLELWNKYQDEGEREKVASSFFYNRRYGKYAGDKIYIKDQKPDKMPDNWNKFKKNIVIFNSSEDELGAISRKFDDANIFGNQLNAIKEVVEHYKDNSSIHFTLRVHPNLKGIPFAYHTDLYKLNYSNLTVIPADSDISTYALMDEADKIIVFGSTTGVEATYWGKPTINLGLGFYNYFDVAYQPREKSEIWNLIETAHLQPKSKNDAMKYGLFFMSDKHEKFKKYFPQERTIKFGPFHACTYANSKILGSWVIYRLFEKLYYEVTSLFCKTYRYDV